MAEPNAQPQQPPGPDPALKRLDRFAGTWNLKGRTLDSDVDNVSGRTTFEWLSRAASSSRSGSTVFSNVAGTPLPYRWESKGAT